MNEFWTLYREACKNHDLITDPWVRLVARNGDNKFCCYCPLTLAYFQKTGIKLGNSQFERCGLEVGLTTGEAHDIACAADFDTRYISEENPQTSRVELNQKLRNIAKGIE